MTAKPIPSAPRYIYVASAATVTSTFRLEVQALGTAHAPSRHELEYTRNDQKWFMSVTHHTKYGFIVEVDSADPTLRFTYMQYQRTDDADIEYKVPDTYLDKGCEVASFFVGVEVTVSEEPSAVVHKSPWNFTSSEQMDNWDVVLCVRETKFYAHKQTLSLVSPTFQKTFNANFREKNQQEVPVNVEGTNAEHFEAFLQCVYPFASEPKAEFIVELITLADYYNVKPLLEKCLTVLKGLPSVPNMVKLRVALKVNSMALEEGVVASLTKDDLQELLASDLSDQLGDARWKKLMARSLAL